MKLSADLQSGKSLAELLMERTFRAINHDMIPKNKTNEPAASHKRGGFTVSNLVFVRDFRARAVETVIKRPEKLSLKFG